MSTEVHVVEIGDALQVNVARKPSLSEGFVSAAVAIGCVAILMSSVFARPVVIVVAIAAGSIAFLHSMRKTISQLIVTKLEFVSRGKVGDNIGSMRTVCLADVQWLEYQEDTSGPESSSHPGGLYAVVGRRSVCLLPDIDEAQTALIIDRILDKFPGFRQQCRANSPFGKNFTLLGLNEPQ